MIESELLATAISVPGVARFARPNRNAAPFTEKRTISWTRPTPIIYNFASSLGGEIMLAKRILVVDDNKDAAESLGFLLTTAGFQVETCLDGETALDVADRFHPDVCLLDINMPDMDGYELARQLVEKSPDNPPLLASVTGYNDYLHLRQAADAGFDLHFTKPANPRDVVEQLGDCIRPRS